jgi:hypothetical protein
MTAETSEASAIDYNADRRTYYRKNRDKILEREHKRYMTITGQDKPRRPRIDDNTLKEFIEKLPLDGLNKTIYKINFIANQYYKIHNIKLSYNKLYMFLKKYF